MQPLNESQRIVEPITSCGLVGFNAAGGLLALTPVTDGTEIRYLADVRGCICIICERGWQNTRESLTDQYVWDLDDRALVHKSCLIRFSGLRERVDLYNALCGVVRFRDFHTTTNRYWPATDPWSKKPWYRATIYAPAEDGEREVELLAGRRKKVVEIRLNPRGALWSWHEDARAAFVDEKVTKEFKPSQILVHAWTVADMRRYIEMLAVAGGFGIGA